MRKIKRILRDMSGKQYIVKDLDDAFHTANDSISKEELQKTGLVISEKGTMYFCLKPGFAMFSSFQCFSLRFSSPLMC